MSFARILVFVAGLISSTCVLANGPWYNDSGDCRRHWWNYAEGCRIRQVERTKELASIDIHIAAAASACDAAILPKQAAAEKHARLDEKLRDREEVFVPYLRRTITLCQEMSNLLINTAARELSRVKSLIEFVAIRASDDAGADSTVSAVHAAALTLEATDALALSLILDSSLEDTETKPSATSQQSGDPRVVTLGFILKKLESATETVEQIHQKLAATLGRLTAENELELSTQEQQLEALKLETAQALKDKQRATKDYEDFSQKTRSLRSRKEDLPRQIREQELCWGVGMQYHNTDCHRHFHPQRPFSEREHNGGGSGRL